MTPLRFRQRWTPLWISIPLLGAYLVLLYFLVRELGHPGQGARVGVPPFLLLGALVIPAAVNARIITAGPQGVKVTNGPIPRGRTVDIAREDIRYCNVRVQYSNFESETSSAKVANYLVGVETRRGQVDIAYPYLKIEDAQDVAERIAAALNQGKLLPRIPVTRATGAPDADSGWRRRVLLWGGMFILATVLGAVWETS